jgi:hypothetical protein
MKVAIARMSLVLALAAILAVVSVSLSASPVAAETTRIPIVNYFISCEQVSIDRVWIEDGVKHVRGRHLVGEVRSTENFHAGPATNLANANVVLATGHGTFHGKLEMHPVAYPDGWWEGSFSIQGFAVPGGQTGVARLKGYGDLAGYGTKTTVTHMPGPALHALFPDACGGEIPLGGSRAEGFVMLPGGE